MLIAEPGIFARCRGRRRVSAETTLEDPDIDEVAPRRAAQTAPLVRSQSSLGVLAAPLLRRTRRALVFLCASLTPSLLPRGWVLQGVVSGVTAIIGYGIGSLLSS